MASSAESEGGAGGPDLAVEPQTPQTGKSKATATTFLSLPVETQRHIFSRSQPSELICLALVSKHFRILAAEQIYRSFHIVFPDDDDPSFDSPIDSLASGLETFATSDYNYASHVRELSLDTLSTGEKGELAYKGFMYNQSCGKFLNTLLLLALRRATSLETFRWNVRVELSRPVFKELHKIASLSHLHIRLQVGSSLFEIPPPLPHNPDASDSDPNGDGWHAALPPLPLSPAVGTSSLFSGGYPSSAANIQHPLPPVPKLFNPRPKQKAPLDNEPPTLSGFKKLRSLSVLDIDNLDLVTELKSCIRNSSLTLRKIKLSFSTSLAAQARKPRADNVPDDIDPDDEFQPITVPPSPSLDEASMPVKVFRAREERGAQEAVLGRVFELEPFRVKVLENDSEKGPKTTSEEKDNGTPQVSRSSAQAFVDRLKEVSERLAKDAEDGARDPESSAEVLDLIQKAATMYLNSDESKDAPGTKKGGTGDNKTSAAVSRSRAGKDVIPEDIDIEEPIEPVETAETEDVQEAAETGSKTEPKLDSDKNTPPASTETDDPALPNEVNLNPDSPRVHAALESQRANFKTVVTRLKKLQGEASAVQERLSDMIEQDSKVEDVLKIEEQAHKCGLEIRTAQRDLSTVRKEIQDAARQAGENVNEEERQYAEVCEYSRTTRGLALRSFSVYLIPLKPNVLKKAVDLRVLQRLTLLNVGSQSPIWSMLNKENKATPLPLCKVSTDNVSPQFLKCMANLNKLEELFLMQRAESHRPEPLEERSDVKLKQIRRAILKKHMPTLKKIMINNEFDSSWDVDEKTMLLLCNGGVELVELAVSMGIRAVHIFMQNMPKLVNLYAFNVIHFRANDTCPWVMRETRHFLIDNLSHHPELKLEWISIDEDRVERVVREPKDEKKSTDDEGENGEGEESKKKKKQKHKKKDKKGKATPGVSPSSLSYAMGGSAYPPLPLADDWDAATDSDDEDADEKAYTKLETVENLRYYDAYDARIFKKEVMAGRL